MENSSLPPSPSGSTATIATLLDSEGAVYIDHMMISRPLIQGQMIRTVRVDDGLWYFYICDETLRSLCERGGPLEYRLPASNLLDIAIGLQRTLIHQRNLSEDTSQRLAALQVIIRHHLTKPIQSYAHTWKRIQDDWNSDGPGPGPSAREFIAFALSDLQYEPASVAIDQEGKITYDGTWRQSRRHIIEADRNGVRFDFSPSLEPSSVLFLTWENLRPLHQLGIKFSTKIPSMIALAKWFGSTECSGIDQSPDQKPTDEDDDGDHEAGCVEEDRAAGGR